MNEFTDYTDMNFQVAVDLGGPAGHPIRVTEVLDNGDDDDVYYLSCGEALDLIDDLRRAVSAHKARRA